MKACLCTPGPQHGGVWLSVWCHSMSSCGLSGPLPNAGPTYHRSCAECVVFPRDSSLEGEKEGFIVWAFSLCPAPPSLSNSRHLTELLVSCWQLSPSDRQFLLQYSLYTRWCDLCLLLILDLQQMPSLLGPGYVRSRLIKQRQRPQMPRKFNNRARWLGLPLC